MEKQSIWLVCSFIGVYVIVATVALELIVEMSLTEF
jgi:hypothetical protein